MAERVPWWVKAAHDLKTRSTCKSTPECKHPENDPVCTVCMAGFNAALAEDPGRTWEWWFNLVPWHREVWRREAAGWSPEIT